MKALARLLSGPNAHRRQTDTLSCKFTVRSGSSRTRHAWMQASPVAQESVRLKPTFPSLNFKWRFLGVKLSLNRQKWGTRLGSIAHAGHAMQQGFHDGRGGRRPPAMSSRLVLPNVPPTACRRIFLRLVVSGVYRFPVPPPGTAPILEQKLPPVPPATNNGLIEARPSANERNRLAGGPGFGTSNTVGSATG